MKYQDFVKIIQEKIKDISDKTKKLNIVREELQKCILYSVYSRKSNIYFLWWTNLRICYNLDRFSEDLDFALDTPNLDYSIEDVLEPLISDFKKENWFNMSIRIWSVSTVRKALIKFSDILYDTGISPLKDEKVTIKLEIDTNPAFWSEYSTKIVPSLFWVCIIKNQDINSTFSWKIWALILREYVKGRDYYDMYWYLDNFSHKQFNLLYLKKIIEQYNSNNDSKKITVPETNKEVLNMVLEKIEETDYEQVKSDLTRFVTWDKKHLNLFFDDYKDTMFIMIRKYNDNLEWGNTEKKFRL